jgi:hypothetical protein
VHRALNTQHCYSVSLPVVNPRPSRCLVRGKSGPFTELQSAHALGGSRSSC